MKFFALRTRASNLVSRYLNFCHLCFLSLPPVKRPPRYHQIPWIALLAAVCYAPGTHCWHGISHLAGLEHRDCRLRPKSANLGNQECCCQISASRNSQLTLPPYRKFIGWDHSPDGNRNGESCSLCITFHNLVIYGNSSVIELVVGVFQQPMFFRLQFLELCSSWSQARAPPCYKPTLKF